MKTKAIVKDQIEIDAPIATVWKVLTRTEYYRQWDELPEDFSAEVLSKDDIIEWEGYSKMTVTECKENDVLKLDLYLPRVDMDPSEYDVSYAFYLSEKDGKTQLNFIIGDFSPLPDAQSYYDATIEFVNTAKNKIKALAEES